MSKSTLANGQVWDQGNWQIQINNLTQGNLEYDITIDVREPGTYHLTLNLANISPIEQKLAKLEEAIKQIGEYYSLDTIEKVYP